MSHLWEPIGTFSPEEVGTDEPHHNLFHSPVIVRFKKVLYCQFNQTETIFFVLYQYYYYKLIFKDVFNSIFQSLTEHNIENLNKLFYFWIN